MTVFEWAMRHGISTVALHELLSVITPTRGIPPEPAASRFQSEAAVQADLQIEASRRGGELWRNNNGALKDETGRLIRYGLGNTSAAISSEFKSSDLIGIFPRMITPDMVGSVIGQFAAVEVKKPGWKKPSDDREHAQARFLSTVVALGGYGRFAQATGDVFK